MKLPSSSQAGFTMIELIIVIVILGILAAIALPKFVDVSDDARLAATKGVAGALASASSINYGGCLVTSQLPSTTDPKKCVKVTSCTAADLAPLMQSGLPTDYTVGFTGGSGTAATAAGVPLACTVTGPGTSPKTADFTAMSAGL